MGKMMPRRSRRRRNRQRFLKTVCIGACLLLALYFGSDYLARGIPEVTGSHPALSYLLAGLIVFWLVKRGRRFGATRRARRVASGIDQLHALSPYEFEAFVHDLLSAVGFRDLHLNGGAGDLGVDIWGRTPQGRTAVIQCKRYAPGRKIGSPLIQTFIGMQKVHHGADVGLFVTTGGFTLDAMRLAQVHGIQLIDGRALLKLQRQAGMHQRRRFGFLRR
jgi:restriction system protein